MDSNGQAVDVNDGNGSDGNDDGSTSDEDEYREIDNMLVDVLLSPQQDDQGSDDGNYPSGHNLHGEDVEHPLIDDSSDDDHKDDDNNSVNFPTVGNYMTYNDTDASQDVTPDNVDPVSGFMTTNAGDIPCTIDQDPSVDQVSGHVFYNQVAVCTSRRDRQITGTHSQQHFIQRLCATTPGQSCPLLSLEP